MSDDDVRVLPAASRPGLWLHCEDPTAILGDPWGRPTGPRDTDQGPGVAPDRGLFVQALVRLQHAVLSRPQA